jgi:hypothetical protein
MHREQSLSQQSHGVLNATRAVRKNLDMHVGQAIRDVDVARGEQEAESSAQEPGFIKPASRVGMKGLVYAPSMGRWIPLVYMSTQYRYPLRPAVRLTLEQSAV